MKKIIIVMILLGIKIFPLDYQYNGKNLVISNDKIEKAFEIGIDNFIQQYGNNINLEELKILIFSNVLEQEILINSSYAKDIKISEQELESVWNDIKKEFPNDITFYKNLQNQGYTKATLLKDIKEKILLDKIKEKIESTVKVSEQEAIDYFKENKYNDYFIGLTDDNIKKDITESLTEKQKGEVLRYVIENEIKKVILPKKSEFSKYYAKLVYKKEGFEFTNIDLANRKIMGIIQGLSDEALLEELAKEGIDKEMNIVKEAKALNLKTPEKLAKNDKIDAYKDLYRKKLIETTKVNDKELKEYFNLNKEKYFIPETYDVNLIELPIEILDDDKKIIKDKAQRILNLALSGDDFEELAKKYSEDSSAQNGGDLGWFSRGQMIETFEKASFEGEIGKVIPYLLETEFGYHIIKVNNKNYNDSEVNASHILLIVSPSENSKLKTEKQAKEIIEQINNKKLTFSDATKYSIIKGEYEFKNIKKGQYIVGIGENQLLEEAIASSKVNELSYFISDKAYIFVKTKQNSALEPTLENSIERVKYDLVRDIVSEKISKVYK